ncbi:MAG: hypothetical protein MK105_15490 [Crocinitomicaceae bacterium]|nr:hypothetical protein [Crocinitomicaceae bacterium]
MKKVLFVASVLGILALQSCKKTYSCVCYYSDGTSETTTLKGGSISELQAECLDICG